MLSLRSLRSLRPRRDNQYWVGFVKISAAFGGLDTIIGGAPRTKFIDETQSRESSGKLRTELSTIQSGQKVDPPARGQPALMQDPQLGPSREGRAANVTVQRRASTPKRRRSDGIELPRPYNRDPAKFIFPESTAKHFKPGGRRHLCEQSDALVQRAIEYFETNACFTEDKRVNGVNIVSKIFGISQPCVKRVSERKPRALLSLSLSAAQRRRKGQESNDAKKIP
ncbi:hypothetical protein DdX_09542 [Ditylenchus destructor]|uniref:Uncharacterized protein n=1 Tax=Ditylenchus destructor TaxID=166010 RepID=A0AAD4MZE7_9BILA|nr:hypothetical protein DdX_09542 [Ditylenchus destructor]